MRKTLTGVALTLAGCGGLVAPAIAQDARTLHDEVRTRVCQVVGDQGSSREAVREALARDPDFERLLENIRREALSSTRSIPYAEDSLQEALLKIWRGRPDLFIEGHDAVVRYVRTATRHNAITRIGKDRTDSVDDPAEIEAQQTAGPVDTAAAVDLLEELEARLDPEERLALEDLIGGAHSGRELARAQGGSRHAAARKTQSIERKLDRLLQSN